MEKNKMEIKIRITVGFTITISITIRITTLKITMASGFTVVVTRGRQTHRQTYKMFFAHTTG
jgi:hypothetical protein